MAFDRSGSVTFSGAISGTGSLVQLGGGTLILTADNTYTGGTIVNAGTLQLGDGINTASLAGANGSNGSPGGAGTDAVTVNNSATFNVMTNASVSGGAGGVGAGLTTPATVARRLASALGAPSPTAAPFPGAPAVNGAQIANGGNGGEAVSFSAGGSLTNSGTISGGAAGDGRPLRRQRRQRRGGSQLQRWGLTSPTAAPSLGAPAVPAAQRRQRRGGSQLQRWGLSHQQRHHLWGHRRRPVLAAPMAQAGLASSSAVRRASSPTKAAASSTAVS